MITLFVVSLQFLLHLDENVLHTTDLNIKVEIYNFFVTIVVNSILELRVIRNIFLLLFDLKYKNYMLDNIIYIQHIMLYLKNFIENVIAIFYLCFNWT